MNDEARGARYSDLFAGRGHDHTPDCAYCPICAAIAVVRKTRPDVLEHLSAAAREVIIAVGIMLEEAGDVLGAEAPDGASQTAGENKVRRIDVG